MIGFEPGRVGGGQIDTLDPGQIVVDFGVLVELGEGLGEQLADQGVVEQLGAGFLGRGEVGEAVAESERLAQLGPFVEDRLDTAVVGLEKLAEHEDGEELGAGVVAAAELVGVAGQRFASRLISSLGDLQRRLTGAAHTLPIGRPISFSTGHSDYRFRQFCEDRGLGYVVAISSQARLFLNGRRTRVDEHVGQIPKRAWRRLSCGSGLKGERLYDWAFVAWPHYDNPNLSRGFLVRRSLSDPNDVAYFFTSAPKRTTLKTIVRIAASRWAIEECFEQAKQETGLDEYDVRSWIGWHRHITLSMLAHATLAVIRSRARGG